MAVLSYHRSNRNLAELASSNERLSKNKSLKTFRPWVEVDRFPFSSAAVAALASCVYTEGVVILYHLTEK